MMHTNYKSKRGPKRFFMFLLFATAAALTIGAVVMFLWNAILPPLLNINQITYWQAVGLLVLCKILFGNFGPGSRGGSPSFGRTHWKERWTTMSEEEKVKFREEWKKRCDQRKG